MAFINLFSTLAAVEGDDKRPGEAAFKCREHSKNIRRGRARKHEPQEEQAGPAEKRHYQAQTTSACNATLDDHKAENYHMQSADGEHASVGFTREMRQSSSNEVGHNDMRHRGQSYKTKNHRNVNKQQQQQQQKRKVEWQKNQHQQKHKGRAAQRGGGHQARSSLRGGGGKRKYKNEQDFEVKRKRHMTQEFMEQNALLVDGRLLCRHFLRGKCVKGEDCQLEHIQAYNDLLKELCKFYVQGSCTKGDSCPYMHKSFPCKFFHRKGKCNQGADCRFSHEPLDDVTNRLLDEELKRENDLYVLKNAEQESSLQAANTDESEITEANITSDTLTQPLRLNFYKSADRNAENEASLCQSEELAESTEEAVQPHAADAAQPHGPALTDHQEPVCYSVEAVLGPQLSKQFPSFSVTPRSQESAPLSSSDHTSGSANQTQAPYSVDAVLRSYKSVEKSTSGHTPTPRTAHVLSYSPQTDFRQIIDPLLISETQNENVLHLENTRNGENKSQEKMFKSLSSLPTQSSLISGICPRRSVASGYNNKQGIKMPESLKPAPRASPGVKLDTTRSVNSSSEDPLHCGPAKQRSIFSSSPTQTSLSRHPTHLKSHLSVLTSDPQASFKPFCASAGVTEVKGGAAVSVEPSISSMKSSDSANSVSLHFAAKQPTKIHQYPKKTKSGLQLGTKQLCSTERTAASSSEMAPCGDLAVGCKNTLKTNFSSLFAKPISDSLQPKDESQTSSSCPPSLIQSPCPATQSENCKSVKTVPAPDKASTRSFLSLFSAPLSAAPLSCVQSLPDFSKSSSCSQQSLQSNDNTPHLSHYKERVDIREASNPPRCLKSSPHIEKDSTESRNRATKQPVNLVCNSESDSLTETSSNSAAGNSPSTSHAHQRPADVSPHKGSAVAATASSVLKTLFVRLSPYHQDGEQPDSAVPLRR